MSWSSFIEWRYSAIVTKDVMAISHRCLPHGRAPSIILFCALLFAATPSTAITPAASPSIVTPSVLLCYCLAQYCSQHPQNKHRMSLNKGATKLLASQSSKTFLWFLLAPINSCTKKVQKIQKMRILKSWLFGLYFDQHLSNLFKWPTPVKHLSACRIQTLFLCDIHLKLPLIWFVKNFQKSDPFFHKKS